MFCPNCGSKMNDDSAFCGNCGWKNTKKVVSNAPSESIKAVESEKLTKTEKTEESIKEIKVDEPKKTDKIAEDDKNVNQSERFNGNNINNRNIFIIVGIILLILLILFLIFKNKSKNKPEPARPAETKAEIQKKYNDWNYVDGHYFYIDGNGNVLVNQWIDDKYYVGPDGVMYENKWYQDPMTGIYYYLDENGEYVHNAFKMIDGKYYYFDANGALVMNAFVADPNDPTKIMYATVDGSILKTRGFINVGGKLYFIDENGYIVASQWVQLNGNYYYIGENGVLCVNRWIDDKYYVGPDGIMYMNRTSPEGYMLGSDGAITAEGQAMRAAIIQKQIEERQKQYDVAKVSERIQEATIAKETLDFSGIDSFDIVQFGSYEQDNKTSNGKELIDWIVLEKDVVNHKALLWSKYIIDKPSSYTKITNWLDSFYNNAFTTAEKKIILKSSFDNGGSRFVSVISTNELKKYYFYDPDTDIYYNTATSITAYAKAQGVDYNSSNRGGYFTDFNGRYLKPVDWTTTKDKVGIRPLIWVEYTGTASSQKQPTNNSTKSSSTLKIASTETVSDTLYWGEDEKSLTFSIKKPVYTSNDNELLEEINNLTDELIDDIVTVEEERVEESTNRIKKISYATPKITTLSSSKIVIEFEGTITYDDTSLNKKVTRKVVYDRENETGYIE